MRHEWIRYKRDWGEDGTQCAACNYVLLPGEKIGNCLRRLLEDCPGPPKEPAHSGCCRISNEYFVEEFRRVLASWLREVPAASFPKPKPKLPEKIVWLPVHSLTESEDVQLIARHVNAILDYLETRKDSDHE